MNSFVRIRGKTIKGTFQERPNRFLALVKVENKILPAFVPNPGRMHELLASGTTVLLREVLKKNRKTTHDLIGVFVNGQLVSVDPRVSNRLVLEALRKQNIEELSEYYLIKPEFTYGHARFDFFLANEFQKCLLEVKSCTLVEDGVALFPDAETKRGRRHVRDMMKAKEEGYGACILFIIQRTDARVFSPNDETDPLFGRILRDAVAKEVEVYAYYSEFSDSRITLKGKINVKLDPSKQPILAR